MYVTEISYEQIHKGQDPVDGQEKEELFELFFTAKRELILEGRTIRRTWRARDCIIQLASITSRYLHPPGCKSLTDKAAKPRARSLLAFEGNLRRPFLELSCPPYSFPTGGLIAGS